MIGLDLRTVIIISGLLALMLSVVLLFLRFSDPKSIQRFFGSEPSYRPWTAVVVATIPFLLWSGLIEPNFTARVLLLRFLTALLPLPGEHLLDPSRIQSLYITANAFIILALSIGCILMASDKLRELRSASRSSSDAAAMAATWFC